MTSLARTAAAAALSLAVTAVAVVVTVGEHHPPGARHAPWWVYPFLLVFALALGVDGTGRATRFMPVHAVVMCMAITLGPTDMIAVIAATQVPWCVLRRRGPTVTALSVARFAASAGALGLSIHLFVGLNGDVLGDEGVVALAVGALAGQLLDELIRSITSGARPHWRQPVLTTVINAGIGVTLIAACRAGRADNALHWLPVVMLAGSMGLLYVGHRAELGTRHAAEHRRWLDVVRMRDIFSRRQDLADAFSVSVGGAAVLFEAAHVVVEHGNIPEELLSALAGAPLRPDGCRIVQPAWWTRLLGGHALMAADVPFEIGGGTEVSGRLAVAYPVGMLGPRGFRITHELTEGAVEISRAVERDRVDARRDWESKHDAITKTLRPGSFSLALQENLAAWSGTTLLLVDIRGLRHVNDVFGRHAGDVLLRQAASRLRRSLPDETLIGRLGGHMLAAAFPGGDAERAEEAALWLLRVLRSTVAEAGAGVHVAIGIARSPENGTDAESLIRRAELGLDQTVAETGEKPVSSFTDDLEQRAERRQRLVQDLREALAWDEVTVAYQPKVAPDTGQVVGVEALARWTHAELGFIPPDEFILLAENSDLIRPLTVTILRQALRQCRAWSEAGHRLPVAVNLSARSLNHPELLSDVRRLLAESDVPAEHLTLEVTETAVMEQQDSAVSVLMELRGLGVRISLDDFGTGHSSLAYLRRLPADEVKLDRAFTLDLADPRGYALVRASVELAHTLGLSIVAEGVEDASALLSLQALGVDVAQGYHLCRPAPAEKITAWMANRSSRADWAA